MSNNILFIGNSHTYTEPAVAVYRCLQAGGI
jgi:hypothetical protein